MRRASVSWSAWMHGPSQPHRLPPGDNLQNSKSREKLVCHAGIAEVAHRVDGSAIDADFVMNMRAGGASAHTDAAKYVASSDAHARRHRKAGQMAVPRFRAKAVVHDDQPAVAFVLFRVRHHAIAAGANYVAVLRGNIDASVEGAFTAERVQSLTEGSGDASHDRPQRGRK